MMDNHNEVDLSHHQYTRDNSLKGTPMATSLCLILQMCQENSISMMVETKMTMSLRDLMKIYNHWSHLDQETQIKASHSKDLELKGLNTCNHFRIITHLSWFREVWIFRILLRIRQFMIKWVIDWWGTILKCFLKMIKIP